MHIIDCTAAHSTSFLIEDAEEKWYCYEFSDFIVCYHRRMEENRYSVKHANGLYTYYCIEHRI